jgi:hypothetical protein
VDVVLQPVGDAGLQLQVVKGESVTAALSVRAPSRRARLAFLKGESPGFFFSCASDGGVSTVTSAALLAAGAGEEPSSPLSCHEMSSKCPMSSMTGHPVTLVMVPVPVFVPVPVVVPVPVPVPVATRADVSAMRTDCLGCTARGLQWGAACPIAVLVV